MTKAISMANQTWSSYYGHTHVCKVWWGLDTSRNGTTCSIHVHTEPVTVGSGRILFKHGLILFAMVMLISHRLACFHHIFIFK